jgi:hypothetical protein
MAKAAKKILMVKEILHKPFDLNQLRAVLHEYLPAETTKLAAAAS